MTASPSTDKEVMVRQPQRQHQLNHPPGRSEAKPHWRTLLNFRIRLSPSPISLLGPAETIGSTIELLSREGSVLGGYGDSIAIFSGMRL
jgi:hypothetical protein